MAREPYPDKELLSAKEVMYMLSMSRSSFHRFLREKDNGFPVAVYLGKTKKHRRWVKDDVLLYIRGVIRGRPPG